MDARQRLNQLRRSKSKMNGKNKRKSHLNDLRELINKKTFKSRIGFKTRDGLTRRPQLMAHSKNVNVGHKGLRQPNNQKRVTLTEDQRIPKVVVNFDQFNDNSRIAANTSTNAQISSKRAPKNQFQTLVSTQPIIIPQIVPQPSLPIYGMSSNSYVRDESNTVLVSNLNPTLSQTDINELFGEIGPMMRSSKINPTVALIVYESSVDARNACQTYHNRLLDGLPMQCNILSNSDNEYIVESRPKVQMSSYSQQNSSLLASQLRQINEMHPKMTASQAFTTGRKANPNVRFTINV